MKTYHLVEFENEKRHVIKAESVSELYSILKSRYPLDDIRLDGYNYSYVTNAAHFMAAGYPLGNLSISDALRPAHLNLNFYFIIGVTYE